LGSLALLTVARGKPASSVGVVSLLDHDWLSRFLEPFSLPRSSELLRDKEGQGLKPCDYIDISIQPESSRTMYSIVGLLG
jgi:hypothetical protein